MRIESFKDLIEWTRACHAVMAQCLAKCASDNPDERASMMLHYLASHEEKLEKMVALFGDQTSQDAERVKAYDNSLQDGGVSAEEPPECNGRFASLDADQIRDQMFAYHDQIIKFYEEMMVKVKKREMVEMIQEVREMELKESKLLVRQTGRMDDM